MLWVWESVEEDNYIEKECDVVSEEEGDGGDVDGDEREQEGGGVWGRQGGDGSMWHAKGGVAYVA